MCSKPVYLLIRYVSEKVRAMYIVQSVASLSVVLSTFRVCCAVISAFLCFLFSPFVEMVQALQALIGLYKERLMAMPTAPVAYPGIFFGVGSTNSVEDRGQRGRGSGGGIHLVRGSGGSCNLVQEIHII